MVQEQVTVPTKEMKDSAYAMLEATRGSVKGPIRRLTREEKDKIAENILNNLDKQDEIFKKVGL